jgi:hypothetical protein
MPFLSICCCADCSWQPSSAVLPPGTEEIEKWKNGKCNHGALKAQRKLALRASEARRNRNHGALKAQRKLAPRVIKTRRNRNQGALKAQIQSAQGTALGKGIRPTISAPCKGNYINIERLKHGKMERSSCHLLAATG